MSSVRKFFSPRMRRQERLHLRGLSFNHLPHGTSSLGPFMDEDCCVHLQLFHAPQGQWTFWLHPSPNLIIPISIWDIALLPFAFHAQLEHHDFFLEVAEYEDVFFICAGHLLRQIAQTIKSFDLWPHNALAIYFDCSLFSFCRCVDVGSFDRAICIDCYYCYVFPVVSPAFFYDCSPQRTRLCTYAPQVGGDCVYFGE